MIFYFSKDWLIIFSEILYVIFWTMENSIENSFLL